MSDSSIGSDGFRKPKPLSPQEELDNAISEELGQFVESRSSTFTCGGSIPIVSAPQSSSEAGTSTQNAIVVEAAGLKSEPITIRWDSRQSDATHKVTLPIDVSDSDSQAKFGVLINDCQPATFGYQGQDVYDENYRKATKLDTSDFSTNFCPYSLGIIDTIAQVLLPNYSNTNSRTGVRAELYKLNFYSAPAGFFKAHVDTPRSEAQFGSLVVSLPCRHEGGQLIVRHAEHSATYDWSASKAKEGAPAQLQWAAFYSDCEHEVLELTEGHRLTLTYNLYVASGVGQLAGNSPALDVYSLPLYQKIKDALANPIFMPEGGLMGTYCTHVYPYTTDLGKKSLPGILKGADMAVYTVFRALGVRVSAMTILDEEEINRQRQMWGDEYKPITLNCIGEWGEIVSTSSGGYEEEWDVVIRDFTKYKRQKVTWLSGREGKFRSKGFIHMTYGNQADVDSKYTYAALIIQIPAAGKRVSAQTGQ
ncbi:hypothetical protein F4806DRAFT_91726 [Annulohypoxylon nitens]|nr:hypothetical protein F4806DRAFT_91726 [Annulohypoxylon nitens]